MCNACGLPQYLHDGCCFDPACDPHMFRIDYCVHCGFGPVIADPTGYDVEAGKTRMANDPDLQHMQDWAFRRYNEDADDTIYDGADLPRRRSSL